jgi:hypothetical protein
MPLKVYVPNTQNYQDAKDVFVYVPAQGGWVQARSVFVSNGSQWIPGYYATPGTIFPQYAPPTMLSDNGSTATYQASVNWNYSRTFDQSFPARVEFHNQTTGVVQVFQPANKPQSTTFTANVGQTVSTFWRLRLYNGTEFGPLATSQTESVTYGGTSSTIASLNFSYSTFTDDLFVSWSPTNFPSGGYYEIIWTLVGGFSGSKFIFSPASSSTIPYVEHFIDFVDFGGIRTTLQIQVNMYNASGVIVATASTSQPVDVSTLEPV